MPSPLPSFAYAGHDGHLYVRSTDGDDCCVTAALRGKDVACAWPAWAPDGARLAFAAQERREDGAGGLWVVGRDGQGARPVYQAPGERPIYFCWSPDGQHLALLSNTGTGIALMSVSVDGAAPPVKLVEGQPMYATWAPGRAELLIHLGGSVRLNSHAFLGHIGARGDMTRPLAKKPAEFRTPAFAPDGQAALAAVQIDGRDDAIVAIDGLGRETEVRRYAGKSAFLWSPRGGQAAYALAEDVRSPGYSDGLFVATPGRRDERLVATGQVLAFFWSPIGDRLACVMLDAARQRLDVAVVQADGGGRQLLASLAPSQDFMFLVSFFDQHAQSHALWSPDGRYFLVAGKLMRERANGHGLPANDGAYAIPVDGASAPFRVADGTLGVFAP